MSGGACGRPRASDQLRQNEDSDCGVSIIISMLHGGEAVERVEQRRHLLQHRDFGQRDYEICGQAAAGAIEQRLQKKAQRADGARLQFFIRAA